MSGSVSSSMSSVLTKMRKPKKKNSEVERVKVSDVITEVLRRRKDESDQNEMMLFLRREFPMAYNRFIADHGGRVPSIPIFRPPAQTSNDSSALDDPDTVVSVLCTSVGSAVPPTSRELRLPPEKRQAAVYSDVWLALSSIFCFSVPADYMPAEDIIEEVLPVSLTDPGPEKKKKKKGLVAKLNPLNWTGSATRESGKKSHLVFSKCGDYKKDKKLLYADLAEESQRIGQLYAGITREHGVIFDWSLKASKNGVHIQTCDIPGSSFQAMKTDTVIKKDKYTILKVITDDDRAKEYDDSLEGYELVEIADDRSRVRRYFYKGFWPCSPRDFILYTTWRELEDGSILVSTMSPPDELYGHHGSYVRAQVLISGMHIRPIDPSLGGGCSVTCIGHSDLKGSIPSAVINTLSSSVPMKFLSKFRDIVQKER